LTRHRADENQKYVDRKGVKVEPKNPKNKKNNGGGRSSSRELEKEKTGRGQRNSSLVRIGRGDQSTERRGDQINGETGGKVTGQTDGK